MIFKCGIIGLPNVGKSAFFNTLTFSSVKSENFPFCTIHSNHSLVSMLDLRLYQLSKYIQTEDIIFGNIELIDIAGLIQGAAQGEGLGNKFLNDITGVDVLCHVVRCFDKDDIYHINNNINPKKDIEIVHDELILSDILCCERLISLFKKKGSKYYNGGKNVNDVTQIISLLDKCLMYLYDRIMLYQGIFNTTEKTFIRNFNLLTYKPIIYIANIGPNDSDNDINYNSYLNKISEISNIDKIPYISICVVSKLKSAHVNINNTIIKSQLHFEYLFKYSKVFDFINVIYHVLQLKTFFTVNIKAIRAWVTSKDTTAINAANMIHSAFKQKFIRAQVVQYNDFIVYRGGIGALKKYGKIRIEGKNYLVKEGDILNILI